MELLYQTIDADFSHHSNFPCTTTLWIAISSQVSSIHLHARQLKLKEVIVNGTTANFLHIDPLDNILAENVIDPISNHHFRGDMLDCNYRAALEISRIGELQIQLSKEIQDSYGNIDQLPLLSGDIQKNHKGLFATIQSKLHKINTEYRAAKTLNILTPPTSSENAENDGSKTLDHKVVISVMIKYDINMGTQNSLSLTRGLRVQHPFIYTLSGSNALYDVDGVRCWLPCIDHPLGRTCFNVTLHTPSTSQVLCSGRSSGATVNAQGIKTSRYLTDCLIPAYALGFFIGKVDKFSYPLYKTKGSIWVAREISEQIVPNLSSESTDDEGESEGDEEKQSQALLHSVRHTTLGLDLGCRKLHKFVGRQLSSGAYTEVFIPELGRDMLTFHGLSFIDISFLHSNEQIFMETPAHLLQLTAYLYSWFKTAIPIDSFASAFLIHGSVGYCINCYVEHVYGEDAGTFRFQKMYDTVLGFERIGRGLPLYSEFPEMHECFDPSYHAFMMAKSSVLFHLIENKVGDRDLMRTNLMNIVEAPFLFNAREYFRRSACASQAVLMRERGYSTDMDPLLHFVRQRSQSFDSNNALKDNDSESMTPFYGGSTSNTPYHGATTPFINNQTPLRSEQNTPWRDNGVEIDKDNFPIPKLVERAPLVEKTDALMIDREFISGTEFISSIRKQGGMASTIEDNFIERYVRGCGLSLFRMNPRLSDKDDNRLKLLNVEMEQLQVSRGQLAKPYFNVLGTMQVRIFDNNNEMSEGSVSFRSSTETYVHHIHVKRSFGPKPKLKEGVRNKDGIQGIDTLTMSAEVQSRRTALEIARAVVTPVKNVEIDPYITNLRDVYMSGCTSYLIERLHKEVDRLDTLSHMLCLRLLVKSGGPMQALHEAMQGFYVANAAPKEPKGQGADDVQSISKEKSVELPLNLYSRAEAAICLAKWQNAKGAKLNGEDSDWEGRTALINFIGTVFLDPETNRPNRNVFDDESLTYFRNILLLSLASIQTKGTQTPQMIIKHLLNFYDNNNNTPVEGDEKSRVYDDAHYRAVLLMCLSKIKFSSGMKNLNSYISKLYKTARSVVDAEEAHAWTELRLDNSITARLPAGGILSASAISCLAEMEIQELLVGVPDIPAYFKSGDPSAFEYDSYFRSSSSRITPPLVRSAALEGFVRVMWCKQYQSRLAPECIDEFASKAIEAVCDVVSSDINAAVRSNAAMALLHVVQHRPPRVAAAALSLGEHLSSIDAADPGAYTNVYSSGKYCKPFKEIMTRNSPVFQRSLQRLWNLIALGLAHDQGARSILLSCWLYCFGSSRPINILPAQEPSMSSDFSYPNSIIDSFQEMHFKNPTEVSSKVEKALRNGIDLTIIHNREEAALIPRATPAVIAEKIPTLKFSIKRPREDIEQSLQTEDELPINSIAKKPTLKFVVS